MNIYKSRGQYFFLFGYSRFAWQSYYLTSVIPITIELVF